MEDSRYNNAASEHGYRKKIFVEILSPLDILRRDILIRENYVYLLMRSI